MYIYTHVYLLPLNTLYLKFGIQFLYLQMKCLETCSSTSLLRLGRHLPVETYKHIISELEVIGLEHVLHISNTLNELKLQTLDQAGRNHILTLSLGVNYPSSPPVIQADLPEHIIGNMKKVSSIQILCWTYEFCDLLYTQFQELAIISSSGCYSDSFHFKVIGCYRN